MNATQVKASTTRFPKLTRAMIRQTGRENLAEIATHSADAGWAGLTYHADTLPFYRRNKKDILALAEDVAENFGEGAFRMIAQFGCFNGQSLSDWEISQGLNGRGQYVTAVQNALTWFAAEEIARELNPEA